MKVYVIMFCALLSACTLQPRGVSYYQFSEVQGNVVSSAQPSNPLLVIEQPTLLGMLAEQGIAVRYDRNQLRNANYFLWSSQPGQMLLNAAHQGLLQPDWTALTRFQFQPLSNNNIEYYQLAWQLHRFNGTMQGNVEIAGQWQLYHHGSDAVPALLAVQSFSATSPIEDKGFGYVVDALDKAWQQVLGDVTDDLRVLLPAE